MDDYNIMVWALGTTYVNSICQAYLQKKAQAYPSNILCFCPSCILV